VCVPGQHAALPPGAVHAALPADGVQADAPGTPASAPSSPAVALAGLEASLGYLAAADVADWPAEALARCLRTLGRVESAQIAAHSRALSAFNAQGGFEADGQPTVRTWLRWQTQITNAASHGAAAWMKRLAVHPRVAAAMGAGQVTASFARLVCDVSDLLPPELRDEADEILLAAVAGGATQADLGMLGQEMLERSAPPDGDGPDDGLDDDGFAGRRVWLDLHFRGAGKLSGDLTPECAAALTAMLDALGKKAGPEDDRTPSQRRHDALEEACQCWLPSCIVLGSVGDPLSCWPGGVSAGLGGGNWGHSHAVAAREAWSFSGA